MARRYGDRSGRLGVPAAAGDFPLQVRRAFRTHGRAAVEACGLPWPEQLDAALAAYYERELGSS
ncbi:MAG: hypothetical protein ACRDQA_21990 [Nocardioidaceae bacterium]